MCTNGLPNNTDGVFAPYTGCASISTTSSSAEVWARAVSTYRTAIGIAITLIATEAMRIAIA